LFVRRVVFNPLIYLLYHSLLISILIYNNFEKINGLFLGWLEQLRSETTIIQEGLQATRLADFSSRDRLGLKRAPARVKACAG